MPIALPLDLVQDVRDPVAGDSYNWDGIEPAAAKKSIVIHHTGVMSHIPQDAFTIAQYHVNHNGWGGIGYNLVVLSSGAIQYAGDLLTYRAHVANNNPGRIGICLVGDFRNELPTQDQLHATRKLIDYLLAPNGLLPSLNYYNQVSYHNAIPNQSTECPGWSGAGFGEWMSYLQGGGFPDYLYLASPPPAPIPVPVIPEVVPVITSVPEWVATWTPETRSDTIQHDCAVVDVTTMTPVANLAKGTVIANIAGHFQANGLKYYRTQWSVDHGKWNGINVANFVAEVPVTVGDQEALPSDHVIDLSPPFVEASPNEDAIRTAFLNLPADEQATFWRKLWEPIAWLIGRIFKSSKKG